MNKLLNSEEGMCRNLSSYFRYYTRMEFLNPLGVSGGHSKVILPVWTSSREEQRTKISMIHPQLWAGRDKREKVRMSSVIMNPHRPPNPPIFNPWAPTLPKETWHWDAFHEWLTPPAVWRALPDTGVHAEPKTEGMDAFKNCCETRSKGDFWPRHGPSARGLSLTAVDISEFWCCVRSFQATHSLFSCSPASIQRKVDERHLAR